MSSEIEPYQYNQVRAIEQSIREVKPHCDEKYQQMFGLDHFMVQLQAPHTMMLDLKGHQASAKPHLQSAFNRRMHAENPFVSSLCRTNGWDLQTMYGWSTQATNSTDGLTMRAHLQASYKRKPHELDAAMKALKLTSTWRDLAAQYIELFKERYAVAPSVMDLAHRLLLDVSKVRADRVEAALYILCGQPKAILDDVVVVFETADAFTGSKGPGGARAPAGGQSGTAMEIDTVPAVDLSDTLTGVQGIHRLEVAAKQAVAAGNAQLVAALQSKGLCFFCQQAGHFQFQCPARLKEEAERAKAVQVDKSKALDRQAARFKASGKGKGAQ